jgi:hypothetical protein
MDTLILIYFVALSMELVLSIGMLVLLWLIIAPRGARPATSETSQTAPPRSLPHTPASALNAAFQSVSRGSDELAVLMHARQLLAQTINRES